MIIFVPEVANSVGVYDPDDEISQLIDITAQLSSGFKFACAAPAATGKLISRPDCADSVGCLRPRRLEFPAHRHLRAAE